MKKKEIFMKKLVLAALLALTTITPALLADFGDVLMPTAVGAGLGGAFGGGRGAAIGAGVGLGVGLMGESRRRDRYYYDDYDNYGYRPVKYRGTGTYYRQPVYQQPYFDNDGRKVYPNFDPMNID